MEIYIKMEKSNWSRLGYIVGLIWTLGFAVRYIFIWTDYSQAIIFCGLGLSFIAFSWVYDEILRINIRLSSLEDYISENN